MTESPPSPGISTSDVFVSYASQDAPVAHTIVETLEAQGIKGIKTVVREGHPAEEILGAAKELGAEMIIIGSRGKRVHTLLMGSVSREIANRSEVPVLIAR